MAVYKVIQDIEAEDKLLGPLTLKGFIYAVIAAFLAFINFKILVSSELGYFRLLLMLLFGLPMLLFGVLASPLGREQPTEVWILSRVKFFLMPHRRIWDQSGIKELVTITAPKTPQNAQFQKHLSENEAQSRLKALAIAMDSHGWAVKNANAHQTSEVQTTAAPTAQDSDRLVGLSSLVHGEPLADVRPQDDILDEKNNPAAAKVDEMMRVKAEEQKRQLQAKIKAQQEAERLAAAKSEQELLAEINQRQAEEGQRFAAAEAAFESEHPRAAGASANAIQTTPSPNNVSLAQNADPLSVAAVAQIANRQGAAG